MLVPAIAEASEEGLGKEQFILSKQGTEIWPHVLLHL